MPTFRFFVLWRKKHTQRNYSLLDFLSFAAKTIRNPTSQYSSCQKLTLTLLSISFSSLFFYFINDSATLILKTLILPMSSLPVFLFIPNLSPSLLLAFIFYCFISGLYSSGSGSSHCFLLPIWNTWCLKDQLCFWVSQVWIQILSPPPLSHVT